MDLPRQGSQAITPSDVPSTSGQDEAMPLVSTQSTHIQSPFAAPYLASPAAAPAVQQAPISLTQQKATARPASSNSLSRRLSRKISGNKMIVSHSQSMRLQDGEVMLLPETAEFAQAGPASTDDLEVCFSGKSARAFRSMVRPAELRPVTAH